MTVATDEARNLIDKLREHDISQLSDLPTVIEFLRQLADLPKVLDALDREVDVKTSVNLLEKTVAAMQVEFTLKLGDAQKQLASMEDTLRKQTDQLYLSQSEHEKMVSDVHIVLNQLGDYLRRHT